jgi:hypothetical protein
MGEKDTIPLLTKTLLQSHQYISNASKLQAHIQPTNHKQTPSELFFVNLLLINLHIVPVYIINIQKEWHWPPNIKKIDRRE